MKNQSDTYQNITHLNRQHKHIDDLFVTHQKFLMHGEMGKASETLLELRKFLKYHLEAEDKVLIPLYEKLVSPIPAGGAVEFFIHEHNKINRYMDEFYGRSIDTSADSLDLVHLFDEHYKFKHLLDHHHTREDTFLFRLLDRVLTEEKKKEVLTHFIFINT
jgi:hemerythrin-like domain-containing protein